MKNTIESHRMFSCLNQLKGGMSVTEDELQSNIQWHILLSKGVANGYDREKGSRCLPESRKSVEKMKVWVKLQNAEQKEIMR